MSGEGQGNCEMKTWNIRAARLTVGAFASGLALLAACGDDSGGAPANGVSSGGAAATAGASSTPAGGTSTGGAAAGASATGGAAAGAGSGVTPPGNVEMPGAGAGLDNPPLPPGGGNGANVADAGTEGTPPDAAAPVTPPEATGFAPCPTDGSPCKIMPLGDSITFGIGSSGGGYRVQLFRDALADQRAITFVGTSQPPNGPAQVNGQPFPQAHQGHSGFTISGGGAGSLAGLVDAAIASTQPDIILLLIGTNDINGNIDVANAPQRLGALLDQLTTDAPDALLAVAQIVPTTNAGTNQRVQAYNAAIPALVQERVAAGRHLILVDTFTPFINTPNFATAIMNDMLHPNDAGYVVLGDTWYQAIDEFLPQ
jgi:lysophospholipase L1-like esterase